jgi:hypothetical protein
MRRDVQIAAAVLALVATTLILGLFGDGFGREESRKAAAAAGQAALPPDLGRSRQAIVATPAPQAGAMLPAAASPAQNTGAGLPPNYIGRDLELFEAHWQGMDARLLDQELRRKLKYPRGLRGILIDEVTLNAADAGFLAGDVIVDVERTRVTTLEEFQRQTRALRNRRQAAVSVLRKGERKADGRFAMVRITLVLRADPDLGYAQVEGAPMILPGDGRPHPYRGACTRCHAVGVGFELTPDPDLITLPPPPILRGTATQELSPHRDRGPCVACHVITR